MYDSPRLAFYIPESQRLLALLGPEDAFPHVHVVFDSGRLDRLVGSSEEGSEGGETGDDDGCVRHNVLAFYLKFDGGLGG